MKGFILEVRPSGGKTFYIRYRNTHGQQKQLKIGSAAVLSADEARKRAQSLLAQICIGRDPIQERQSLKTVPTFNQFVTERYLPFVQGYKRSCKTDECLLRNHILPTFGKQHLNKIVKHDVIALHHGLRAKGYAPATANRVLILIRYVFNLAMRWEIPGVSGNPSTGVPILQENNQKERFLSKEEVQRLYDKILQSENLMLRHIIPMLILTGGRKSEVLKAEWSHFNVERRVWRIPISKSGKARHVPLSNGALRLLSQVPRTQNCTYVFANPKTGKPFVSIFYSWDTARKAAGMPELRIHDLRHSFASFLVNAGRSLYEVQKILGHADSKTTQRYAHLSNQSLIEAANAAAGTINAFAVTVPANLSATETTETTELQQPELLSYNT